MANRVSVSINVNDMTRAGLARVRQSLRQLDRQMNGLGANVRVTLNDDGTRAGIRRVRQAIRRLPNTVTIRTNVRPPDRNQTRNQIIRSMTAPVRAAGRVLGGTLSDGLGQGIANGFRSAGPVIQAALALVILGALSIVGAALAGALVLAIGGAFTAAGALIAFQADGVKEKWKASLEELKPLFADAATGMLPVIENARQQFLKIGKDFAPHFKQALDAAAPHVETFMNRVIEGFRKLGSRSAESLEQAFNVFLDAFGPDLEAMLAGLGDALAALGNTVTKYSGEISMALTSILGLITTLIDIVNFLAVVWSEGLRAMSKTWGYLVQGVAIGIDAILGGFESLITGAANAFSWIPGIGDKLKKAKNDFSSWRDGVKGDLMSTAEGAKNWGAEMDRANRERMLKVNIESWKNQLSRARADLKKTSDQKAEAKLRANISDLTKKISSARAQLNSLNGKTAVTYVLTRHTASYGNVKTNTPGAFAHGGVRGVGAAATGGVRSNMTLVGEQGPELINLAPGSHVKSNPDTRRTLAGMGGGGGAGGPIAVQIMLEGRQVAEAIIDPLRGIVKAKGGNVQNVIGTGRV